MILDLTRKRETLALVQSADGGILSGEISSSSRSVRDKIRHLRAKQRNKQTNTERINK